MVFDASCRVDVFKNDPASTTHSSADRETVLFRVHLQVVVCVRQCLCCGKQMTFCFYCRWLVKEALVKQGPCFNRCILLLRRKQHRHTFRVPFPGANRKRFFVGYLNMLSYFTDEKTVRGLCVFHEPMASTHCKQHVVPPVQVFPTRVLEIHEDSEVKIEVRNMRNISRSVTASP